MFEIKTNSAAKAKHQPIHSGSLDSASADCLTIPPATPETP